MPNGAVSAGSRYRIGAHSYLCSIVRIVHVAASHPEDKIALAVISPRNYRTHVRLTGTARDRSRVPALSVILRKPPFDFECPVDLPRDVGGGRIGVIERNSTRIVGLALSAVDRRLREPVPARRDLNVGPSPSIPSRIVISMIVSSRQPRIRDDRLSAWIQCQIPYPGWNSVELAVVDNRSSAVGNRQVVEASQARAVGLVEFLPFIFEVVDGIFGLIPGMAVGECEMDGGFAVGDDLDVRPDFTGFAPDIANQNARFRPGFPVRRSCVLRLPARAAPDLKSRSSLK